MAPPSKPTADGSDDEQYDMLAEDEAQEVVDGDGNGDGDVVMDSDLDDDDQEEISLQNDCIAYFDGHKHSVFAIAQHPIFRHIIATGGSEGEDEGMPGKGYVLDTSAAPSRPVLPPSFNASGAGEGPPERPALAPLFAIDGHSDSIASLAFTLPRGDFLVSGGMDGRLRACRVISSDTTDAPSFIFNFVAECRETDEILWVAACPSSTHPNTFAMGARDGSVWVFTIETRDSLGEEPDAIRIVQTYFLHTEMCNAGAWTPDGKLLATVSEDGSLHVYDVWGEAAAKSLVTDNGQTVVSLASADQRFRAENGLVSVAVAPSGDLVAVGGGDGSIRVVGLPRLSLSRRGGAPASSEASAQAGSILASLKVQEESVETLAFSPNLTSSSLATSSSSASSSSTNALLLAAGSVDGSIAVFEVGRGFAVRRQINNAHSGYGVVKVEFVRSPPPGSSGSWLLTSCGLDGAVRRWDLRAAATAGPAKEWEGHAPTTDSEDGNSRGGVLGFVQGDTGERVVTAGDDALVLVFEA